MKDVELMVEIFLCFKGAKITGDRLHGYMFEAFGEKKLLTNGVTFSHALEEAIKHFARLSAPHGEECEHN